MKELIICGTLIGIESALIINSIKQFRKKLAIGLLGVLTTIILFCMIMYYRTLHNGTWDAFKYFALGYLLTVAIMANMVMLISLKIMRYIKKKVYTRKQGGKKIFICNNK